MKPFATPHLTHLSANPNFLMTIKSISIHDFGRFFFTNSIKSTNHFLSLVKSYLKHSFSLSEPTIRALEDCHLLSRLNLDNLLNTCQTIDSTNSTLDSSKAYYFQTYLSAVLTNQETCLDGLQEAISSTNSSVKNGLYASLSNGTKLYSMCLALFKRGWVGNYKKRYHMPRFSNSIISGRKLLPTSLVNDLVSQKVVVNQDGSGNFTTINEAVAAAPNNTATSGKYFVIHVVRGVFEEYVSIAKNKQNLMLIGDGINQTVITGNRSVIDGWTTFNSATFAVVGQGFVAINITFRNTAGAMKHQAVAVRNGADLSAFYSCSFEGYQDTLYTHSLRQFYRNCEIYGTVDFIFGNAAVVLQNCNIFPRLPLQNQFNAITAQGRTDPNQNTGISIHNCSIRAADDLASSNSTIRTYLGRPWKEFSRTVYLQSFMDSLIDPAGWVEWNGDLGLSTLYYGEFNNTRLGSNTSSRVTWPGFHMINAIDAVNFTVSNFIMGDFWLPATQVSYIGGLM
ncbi:hypothetical protein UlMin_029140 [Ulmus minor]